MAADPRWAACQGPRGGGPAPEPTACALDSQSAQSAEGGESISFDKFKHCRGRKRHLAADTLGLLQEDGLPEAICSFASHHTGVGLSRDDVLVQGLPLPPAEYLAETGEERLVMDADKFHSKKRPLSHIRR